jgi:hypothetical protein
VVGHPLVVEGDEVLGHVSSFAGVAPAATSTFSTNGGSPIRHRRHERTQYRTQIGISVHSTVLRQEIWHTSILARSHAEGAHPMCPRHRDRIRVTEDDVYEFLIAHGVQRAR